MFSTPWIPESLLSILKDELTSRSITNSIYLNACVDVKHSDTLMYLAGHGLIREIPKALRLSDANKIGVNLENYFKAAWSRSLW